MFNALGQKVEQYVPGAKLQVAKAMDKAKTYINNMSDLEIKVHEATNHDPWGPHGTVMQGERQGAGGAWRSAAVPCYSLLVLHAPLPLTPTPLFPSHRLRPCRDHQCILHVGRLPADHGECALLVRSSHMGGGGGCMRGRGRQSGSRAALGQRPLKPPRHLIAGRPRRAAQGDRGELAARVQEPAAARVHVQARPAGTPPAPCHALMPMRASRLLERAFAAACCD
jgi:hypothetical protein